MFYDLYVVISHLLPSFSLLPKLKSSSFEYSLQVFTNLFHCRNSPSQQGLLQPTHFSFYYLLQWHHFQLLMSVSANVLGSNELCVIARMITSYNNNTNIMNDFQWQSHVTMLVRRIFWIKRYCWKPWKNNRFGGSLTKGLHQLGCS